MVYLAFIGKWGTLISSILFASGVLVSAGSPYWITVTNSFRNSLFLKTEFGPFYSQSRVCTKENDDSSCGAWSMSEVDFNDCGIVELSTDRKLCNQMLTWRIMAMACSIIVMITGCLLTVGCCFGCFTCGCCGDSFDLSGILACWLEVLLSIVCWSFALSTLRILREDLPSASIFFEWAFWVFIFSGTFLGATTATLADIYSSNSFFVKIFSSSLTSQKEWSLGYDENNL